MVIYGIDVQVWGVEVGGCGGDKLRARTSEQVFKERQCLRSTSLQSDKLVAVFFPQRCVDRIVQLRRVERYANGDESVHLIVFFRDGVVLRVFLEILGPRDVDKDVREHANGIGVAAHHHVAEPHIVIRCEMRRHHPCEHGFLVQLDIIQRLQCQREIPQQAVDPQQSNDREVTQHPIERPIAIFASHLIGIFVSLHGIELLIDLAALDERVENIEDGVAAPGIRIFAQKLGFLAGGFGAGDAVAVAAEGFELVDEFVDHVPCPVVLQHPLVTAWI